MQKFTPEYLEAKRLKEKERQHRYYIEITKKKRKKKRQYGEYHPPWMIMK